MSKTSFIATGDVFITRRLPESGYEGFDRVQACIDAGATAVLSPSPTKPLSA